MPEEEALEDLESLLDEADLSDEAFAGEDAPIEDIVPIFVDEEPETLGEATDEDLEGEEGPVMPAEPEAVALPAEPVPTEAVSDAAEEGDVLDDLLQEFE